MDTEFTCTEMVHGLDYSGHSHYNTLTERERKRERAREMSPQYALCLTSAGKFWRWSATTICLLNFVMYVTAQGSFVLVYQEEESSFSEQGIPPLNLVMVGWQGAKSTRAYIPLSDCVHYLRLCGADVSKYGKWYSSSGKRGRMYYMQ